MSWNFTATPDIQWSIFSRKHFHTLLCLELALWFVADDTCSTAAISGIGIQLATGDPLPRCSINMPMCGGVCVFYKQTTMNKSSIAICLTFGIPFMMMMPTALLDILESCSYLYWEKRVEWNTMYQQHGKCDTRVVYSSKWFVQHYDK